MSRGRVVVENGNLSAEKGSGKFVRCGAPEPLRQERKPTTEMRLFKALIS